MVQLGGSNSRMKDFYDIALLARNIDLDGELLSKAVQATFFRRGTPLPLNTPVAFTAAFGHEPNKRTRWSGFARKANVSDMGTLDDAVEAVRQFSRSRWSQLRADERSFEPGALVAPGVSTMTPRREAVAASVSAVRSSFAATERKTAVESSL